MVDVDSRQAINQADPDHMLDRIQELPQQLRDAWKNVSGFQVPAAYRQATKIMILGMGGSAIGADLLRSLVADECPVPVFVNREYGLPKFVDSKTLVIASSYSGNTEETLSAFQQAVDRGAMLLAVTTGGKVAERAAALNIPLLSFSYKAQPRAALGHSLIPLLGILQQLGFVPDKSADVEEAARTLEELGREIGVDRPTEHNAAKQLAKDLRGRLPIVYGSGILSEAARRWKGQFNENSKAWSFFEILPELNHNATVGYENPVDLAPGLFVIFLESAYDHPRVKLRGEITRNILSQRGVGHGVVDARGESALAQMMSTIFFGDYSSFYLAMLYGSDPSPVKVIDYLKGELAKR